jgi:hypothetical protein
LFCSALGAAKSIPECQLILRKPDLALRALKYVYAGRSLETVMVFDDVEFNPKRSVTVDLNGYTPFETWDAKFKESN